MFTHTTGPSSTVQVSSKLPIVHLKCVVYVCTTLSNQTCLGGAHPRLYYLMHWMVDHIMKGKLADPTPDQSNCDTLLLLALLVNHVGQTLEYWACYLCQSCTWGLSSMMLLPGCMKVA